MLLFEKMKVSNAIKKKKKFIPTRFYWETPPEDMAISWTLCILRKCKLTSTQWLIRSFFIPAHRQETEAYQLAVAIKEMTCRSSLAAVLQMCKHDGKMSTWLCQRYLNDSPCVSISWHHRMRSNLPISVFSFSSFCADTNLFLFSFLKSRLLS